MLRIIETPEWESKHNDSCASAPCSLYSGNGRMEPLRPPRTGGAQSNLTWCLWVRLS
jgi:hypothetical protein